MTGFHHHVYALVRRVPPGQVTTYGDVARLLGRPRAARQVGYALAALEQGSDVPWHRVLQASGKIALEKDSRGYREQGKRLTEEGVVVVSGKVDMGTYRWQPDLDELLWKPSAAWDEG